MKISVYRSLEDAKAIIAEYERDNSINIFFTFQWMKNWMDYFNKCYELEVICFFIDDKLIGFIPLYYKKNRILDNKDYHILGEGKSSYLHLPIIEQYKEVVYGELITYLKEIGKNFNITFSDISSNSKDYAVLNNLLNMYKGNRNLLYCCHFANLNCDWNEFFKRHYPNGKKRTSLRSFYKKLQKLGEVSFIRINSGELLEKYHSNFFQTFQVHKLRFENVLNSSNYSNSEYKNFYVNVINEFSKLGLLDLSILCLDNSAISFHLNFKQDNTSIGYITAIDPAFSKYSLGHVSLRLIFEELCNEGKISIFDFSKGDGDFKRKWSDDAYENYSFTFNFYKSKIFNINLYISQLILKLKLYSRTQGWNARIKSSLGKLKNIKNNLTKTKIIISNISDVEKELLELKEFNYLLVENLDLEIKKLILDKLYDGEKIKLGYKQGKLLYIIKEGMIPEYYAIEYKWL